jgi:hypothetical protein
MHLQPWAAQPGPASGSGTAELRGAGAGHHLLGWLWLEVVPGIIGVERHRFHPRSPLRIRNIRHTPVFMRVRDTYRIRNTARLFRIENIANRRSWSGLFRLFHFHGGA